MGGEGWRGEGGGEGVEGVDTMSTYINETGIDVVRSLLGSLVLQDHSPVLICRSHDRSHDSVTTLT